MSKVIKYLDNLLVEKQIWPGKENSKLTPHECVNESKTITTKSGIKGWQNKLRKVYGSLEEFERYCENYGIHKRLGFDSPEEAWEANPTIRGSVKPEDLEVVKEAEEKTPYAIMGQLGSRAPEKLDTADDEHSADYLVGEYKMAFGTKWKIWKEIDK